MSDLNVLQSRLTARMYALCGKYCLLYLDEWIRRKLCWLSCHLEWLGPSFRICTLLRHNCCARFSLHCDCVRQPLSSRFCAFFFVSPETSACTAPDFDYDRAVSMATVRDYWCRRVSQYKPHKFSPTFQRVTPPWVRRQTRLRDYCPHLLLGFILLLVPSSVG